MGTALRPRGVSPGELSQVTEPRDSCTGGGMETSGWPCSRPHAGPVQEAGLRSWREVLSGECLPLQAPRALNKAPSLLSGESLPRWREGFRVKVASAPGLWGERALGELGSS